jgi:two-component system chemotaxis sensor kinase CheA
MMDSTTLLQDFIAETEEHLEEMENNLLRLETHPDDREILNEIFRSAHTIKGSAEYLGVEKIAELSHKLESLLDMLRRGKRLLSKKIIDTLIGARDRISKLIKDLVRVQVEETEIDDLVTNLEALTTGGDNLEETQGAKAPREVPSDKGVNTSDSSDNVESIFKEEAQKNISILVKTLSEMAQGDVRQEKKEGLIKGFDELLRISQYIERVDLIPYLEKLKKKGEKVSSPSEARTLLADLNFLKDLLSRVKATPATQDISKGEALPPPSPETTPKIEEPIQSPEGLAEPTLSQVKPSEISEEEHDQELFNIFIQHLKDQISVIKNQMENLKKPGSGMEPYQKCLECIKGLKSSANYMDYKKLVILYDKWAAEIKQAQEQQSKGGKVSSQFMTAYLNEIFRLFPQCGKPSGEAKKVEVSEGQLEAPPSQPVPPVEKELVIDSLELEQDHTPFEQELLSQLEVALTPQQEVPETQKPESGPKKMEERPVIQKKADLSEPSSRPRIEKGPPASMDMEDHPEGFKSGEESGAQQESLNEQLSDELAEKVVKHNLRVDTKKIDSLMNQVGELVVNRAWFSQLAIEIKELQRQLLESRKLDQKESKQLKAFSFRINEASLILGRAVNELQEGVMKVRMLPISQLFGRYPRLVRRLTEETEKRVRLEISGEETELDKMVIEEVSDPLVHIIRNAVDHGIETVEERRRLKKPEEGRLRLSAYHESNHVVIEVEDDGRGIDLKLLKDTAVAKGIFTEIELDRMNTKELMSIIMKPGFSTATQVTKTSGRGVGMDVVKKNIEKLNGIIEIDSTVGVGTRFRIKIPLTLAIIQALLVRVGAEIFTIPLTSVVETLRFFKKEIDTIEGVEVIHLRHTTIPLLRLSEIFNISTALKNPDKSFVVIIGTGSTQVGLVIDSLVGEQEVVIKPLVDYLQENSGFSGATILGDGRISLILDVYELQNLAIRKKTKKRNNKAFMVTTDNVSTEQQSRITE